MFKQWKLIFMEAIIQEKNPIYKKPKEVIFNLQN